MTLEMTGDLSFHLEKDISALDEIVLFNVCYAIDNDLFIKVRYHKQVWIYKVKNNDPLRYLAGHRDGFSVARCLVSTKKKFTSIRLPEFLIEKIQAYDYRKNSRSIGDCLISILRSQPRVIDVSPCEECMIKSKTVSVSREQKQEINDILKELGEDFCLAIMRRTK